MADLRTFTAIVNPSAGRSSASWGDDPRDTSVKAGPTALRALRRSAGAGKTSPLAHALREAGAEVHVEYSRGLEHAASLARDAAGRGHVVLGVGGDGMVGCVGGALAGTDALFGIVPAGRGNDFARQLGVPSDPAELARLLLEGEPRAVDVIEANGVPVLGSVYAGVDALANANANRSRLLRGSAAYYVGALRAVLGWRPAPYRITVDGEVREREGFTVVAANSGFYGSGLHIAPDAEVDDGLLDVVIVKHASRALFFAVMRELEDGSHVRRPQVEIVRGREVRIELAGSGRTLPYGADGELPGTLPVTARVLPGALRVLA